MGASLTTRTSTLWLPNQDLNKGNINRHVNLEGGIPLGLTPKQRTVGTKRLIRKGKIAFPRDGPRDWLSNTKWSALDIYIHATSNGFTCLFSTFMHHTCMHAYVRINSKRKEVMNMRE